MLYAITSSVHDYSGHINQDSLTINLNEYYYEVTEIRADGDELEYCCKILGRELPPCRVYTFLGVNAQEIARNWR